MAERHELNPIGRFDDRADDYVRFRPGYPAGAMDDILAGLGPPERVAAADIGAGTGIAARLLAGCGARVQAVEPGGTMRAAAAPHPRIAWVDGTAEATTLPTALCDLVLCAQSFHWFRPLAALEEFARILRPGGRLALIWNSRSRRDPFTAAYRQAIRKVAGEIADRTEFDPDILRSCRHFAPPALTVYRNVQRLDFAGLVGRSRSASYVPKTGPAADRLVALLKVVFDRHVDTDGTVTLVYDTEVHVAGRR